MSEPIGVGIIGAGGLATLTHIPGYKSLPEKARIVAVADVVGKVAEKVAKEHEIPMAFDNYDELLALEEVEAVSICTPPVAHRDATIAALEAGKHVLCEKPMAMNAAEAQEMIEAAERTGQLLAIGFQARFSSEAQSLKRLIEGGELGDIYYGRAVYNRRRGIPPWGKFHQFKGQSGGGSLLDVGVHVLDLALWLMGYPKPISVVGSAYCKFGNRGDIYRGDKEWADIVSHRSHHGTWNDKEFEVEDFAVALIKLDNGATLNLECSWALNIAQDLQSIVLCGDEGGAELNPLKVFKDDGHMLIDWEPQGLPDTSYVNMHAKSIENFINAIHGDGEILVTPEQGLYVAQIVDAIYRSGESGQLVTI